MIVYPTTVQGEGAAAEIAQAIRAANERAEVDVLIVGRGGGSIEDLWAFNEEIVAQAVFESRIAHRLRRSVTRPISRSAISSPTCARRRRPAPRRWSRRIARPLRATSPACGCAGSVRCARRSRCGCSGSTRSSGGSCIPRRASRAQAREARALAQRLARAFAHRVDSVAADAGGLGKRLLLAAAAAAAADGAAPSRRRRARAGRGDHARARRTPLAALGQNLALLNPAAALERGYAIVATSSGAIVTSAADVQPGDGVAIPFAHGGAGAKVTRVDH